MLSHEKLSKSFWDKTLIIIVHLINISLDVPLDGDISNKVWTWKYVSYGYRRVFGYKHFICIPRNERYKFDKRSKQCVFVGYNLEEFAYRLWDPLEKKIMRIY